MNYAHNTKPGQLDSGDALACLADGIDAARAAVERGELIALREWIDKAQALIVASMPRTLYVVTMQSGIAGTVSALEHIANVNDAELLHVDLESTAERLFAYIHWPHKQTQLVEALRTHLGTRRVMIIEAASDEQLIALADKGVAL